MPLELEDCLVQEVHLESEENLVPEVQLVLLDHLEKEDPLEAEVCPELMVRQDQRDKGVTEDHLDPVELRVLEVNREDLDHLVYK